MSKTMPIGGFWGPVRVPDTPYKGASKDLIQDEIYALIKGAGINYISFIERDYVTETDEVISNLELAGKYGIGLFIRDTYLTNETTEEELKERVKAYNGYSSFLGITVCDEPGIAEYREKSPHIDTFSKLATKINQSEDMAGYVNLFPKFGEIENLDEVYDKYVNTYLDTCSPKFISYDYYPFHDAQTNKTCWEYFAHLSYYSNKAKERNLPFWPFVEVGGHFWGTVEPWEQIIPTRGQMLWNVNMCLAYGAKGIQYFPLIQPNYWGVVSEEEAEQDFDRCAIIGANGKPTKWYPYVKEANQWIRKIQHVLMEAEHRDVIVNSRAFDEIANATKAEHLSGESEEYGALSGVFAYAEKTVYYIVNYDYDHAQDITLRLDAVRNITGFVQGGADIEARQDYCTVSLEAGCAALIIVE